MLCHSVLYCSMQCVADTTATCFFFCNFPVRWDSGTLVGATWGAVNTPGQKFVRLVSVEFLCHFLKRCGGVIKHKARQETRCSEHHQLRRRMLTALIPLVWCSVLQQNYGKSPVDHFQLVQRLYHVYHLQYPQMSKRLSSDKVDLVQKISGSRK